MENKILETIKAYETIIIHRHTRPDLDAIGSQMGLYYGIKHNFPEKKVFVVGDLNQMSYEAKMDDVDDALYEGALAIVTDVAVAHLVSDDRYKKAAALIVIDHHKNNTDLNPDLFYQKSDFTSAAQIVASLFKTWQLELSQDAATYLYGGMVTDTGRFLYVNGQTAASTFSAASFVSQFNPEIGKLYDYLYLEPLAKKQAKNLFSKFELTPNFVAYRKNTKEIIEASGLDLQSVSRGMVNQMSGILEVAIWASFTEDVEHDVILAEIRARGIEVVDIAKKYGGGGHAQACGASLKTWHDVDLLIKDLDERAEYERNYGTNI